MVGVSLGIFATKARSALVRLSPIRVPSSRFVAAFTRASRRSRRFASRQQSLEIMGVNCDGDSEVEGDVFWTMYPKYKLSY